MKKYIFIAIALLIIIAFGRKAVAMYDEYQTAITDNEHLRIELAHARITQPVEHGTIRDTVPVATVPVTTVDKSSYKNEVADKQILKDLDIKPSEVTTDGSIQQTTQDTVKLSKSADNQFFYKDRWAEFHLSDSTLVYSVRDSIKTIIYREYKHKFLWWRWGTKGYKVKIINFNPNSTIDYSNFVTTK